MNPSEVSSKITPVIFLSAIPQEILAGNSPGGPLGIHPEIPLAIPSEILIQIGQRMQERFLKFVLELLGEVPVWCSSFRHFFRNSSGKFSRDSSESFSNEFYKSFSDIPRGIAR